MTNLDQQLTALRDALRDAEGGDADSFSDVFDTFLELTEASALMDASKPFTDKVLRGVLEQLARTHTKVPTVELAGLRMLHHAPAGFVHGMFFAGAVPGTFFFFLQEQQGIAAFAEGMSTMHFYRMTATLLPAGAVVGRRPRWRN